MIKNTIDDEDKLFEIIKLKIKPFKIELDNTFKQNRRNINHNGLILYKILDDALGLSEDIYVDIYMYNFSMEHYNNPYLFLGHYYTDYATVKINMLWERIINFLGIVYGVQYENKITNNDIKSIYNKLKKINDFTNPLRELLSKLIGDNSFGDVKKDRNSNEHDLTVHLNEKIKKESFKRSYEYNIDENGHPFMDQDTYNEFINESNYLIRKNKTKVVEKIKENLDIFIEIFKECINVFKNNVITNSKSIVIKNMELYCYKYDVKTNEYFKKCKVNLCVEASALLKKAVAIRDRVTNIADTINKNPVLIYQRPPTIQILEYNIDVTYRLVEYIRSLLNELSIINNQEVPMNDNTITGIMYYHNCVLIRLYSCFEKVGKLLYTRFELRDYQGCKKDLKKMYLETIIETATLEEFGDFEVYKKISSIVSSETYKLYKEIRNKSYHGIRAEFILNKPKSDNFWFFTVMIIVDLIKQLIELLEIIEKGEENTLNMHKLLRANGC